jgi:hypothetical protein
MRHHPKSDRLYGRPSASDPGDPSPSDRREHDLAPLGEGEKVPLREGGGELAGQRGGGGRPAEFYLGRGLEAPERRVDLPGATLGILGRPQAPLEAEGHPLPLLPEPLRLPLGILDPDRRRA